MPSIVQDRLQAQIDGPHGFAVLGVFGAEKMLPSFSYTVGMSPTRGYEILVIGLPPRWVVHAFNDMGKDTELKLDVPDCRWFNHPVIFKKADGRAREYVVQADAFYGREIEIVQMVLSDRSGRLPGENGYDEEYMGPLQPLLFDLENS